MARQRSSSNPPGARCTDGGRHGWSRSTATLGPDAGDHLSPVRSKPAVAYSQEMYWASPLP
jgi:hypothetical protein